jgi:integrase
MARFRLSSAQALGFCLGLGFARLWEEFWMGKHLLKLSRLMTVMNIDGLHADGEDLYLQVRGNAASWILRYNFRCKQHDMGLGSLRKIGVHREGLRKVRDRAEYYREQLGLGIDPLAARKEERRMWKEEQEKQKKGKEGEVTFRKCAEGWLADFDKGWSRSVALMTRQRLERHVFRIKKKDGKEIKMEGGIGDLPIKDFDITKNKGAARLIANVLRPIWHRIPSTAADIRQYIHRILKWAWSHDYIDSADAGVLKKGEGRLSSMIRPIEDFYKSKSHRSLPYKDLPALMARLRSPKYVGDGRTFNNPQHLESLPVRARVVKLWAAGMMQKDIAQEVDLHQSSVSRILREARKPRPLLRHVGTEQLEFDILTAQRIGQIIGEKGDNIDPIRWTDVDFDDQLWICAHHKNGKRTGEGLIIPLSTQAMAVLKRMEERQALVGKSEFVFAGGFKAVASMDMFWAKTFPDVHKIATVHGFRTTFGDWSVDAGYDERDSEMALGHVIGTPVRNIYKRHAKRIESRRVMMQAYADFTDGTAPLPASATPERRALRLVS